MNPTLLIGASAVACAVANDPYAFGLRAREALLFAALAFVLAIMESRRRPPASPLRAAGAFVSLALVVFSGPIVDPTQRNIVTIASCLAMLFASSAAFVALDAARRTADRDSASPRRAQLSLGGVPVVVAVVTVAFIASITMGAVARAGRPLIIDEVLYLFQAVTLGEPTFGRRIDPSLEPFFILPQAFVREGVLHGQYPIGWPLLLALGRVLAIQQWLNAVFAAGTVALTFLVGRRIMPRGPALLAATLVALNAMFVESGADFFAHASTTAMALAAAALLLRSADVDVSSRARLWMLAGLAIGAAISIRPLTGVSLGGSLWLWTLIRSRGRDFDLLRMSACMAIGAAPLIAVTLAYNQVVTGAATQFGYASANGDLVDMGFGTRGIVVYDRSGSPAPLTSEFTPLVALRNFVRVTGEFAQAILPSAAVVALLALTARSLRDRRTIAITASFLVLPILQSLYYYASVRFYVELLPFVLLGLCALLAREMPNRAFVRALALFTIVASIVSLAGRFRARDAARADALLANRLVERASAEHGPILVFVADNVPGESMLARLWWYNVDSFRGPIVVARDLGARNTELIRAYPAHTPFRLRRIGGTDAVMNSLERPAPARNGRISASMPQDGSTAQAEVEGGDRFVPRQPGR